MSSPASGGTPALPGFRGVADLVRTQRAAVWNRGVILVASALAVLAAVAVVLMALTGFGSWVTIVLVSVFAGSALLTVRSAVMRARMNRLMQAPGRPALVVDDAGVEPGGTPLIPWNQIVLVSVLDDRGRSGRIGAVPLLGRVARTAGHAGSGMYLCEVGVRDGEGLRLHISDRGAAGRVSLHGRYPDGTRRAVVPLLLDATLTESDTAAAIRALEAHARRRAIPFLLSTSLMDATMWKLPLLEPGLPPSA